MLAFMLTTTMFSQTQQRYVYQNVTVTLNDKVKTSHVESVVYVNYGNQSVIKVYPPNSVSVLYDLDSTVEEGKTDNGSEYWYGIYKKRDTNERIFIQLFKKVEYGIRLISFDGNITIQFY